MSYLIPFSYLLRPLVFLLYPLYQTLTTLQQTRSASRDSSSSNSSDSNRDQKFKLLLLTQWVSFYVIIAVYHLVTISILQDCLWDYVPLFAELELCVGFWLASDEYRGAAWVWEIGKGFYAPFDLKIQDKLKELGVNYRPVISVADDDLSEPRSPTTVNTNTPVQDNTNSTKKDNSKDSNVSNSKKSESQADTNGLRGPREQASGGGE